MHINVDDYLKAVEVPSITINGQTYTTKPLSFKEAVLLQKRLANVSTDNDLEALADLVSHTCKAVGLPEDVLTDLPPDVFMEVVESFFTSLFAGNQKKSANRMNGTKQPKKA